MAMIEESSLPAGSERKHLLPTSMPPESAPVTVDMITGNVDGLDQKWRVIGWAKSAAPGSPPLQVRLMHQGVAIATDTAQRFRGDLLDANIGDGNHAFILTIPPSLFDGNQHSLGVEIDGAPEARRVLGTLDILLPSKPAVARKGYFRSEKASDLLGKVFEEDRHSSLVVNDVYKLELAEILTLLAHVYDFATALGLLYVHVLRRRIDADGLQSKLTMLSTGLTDFEGIIDDVFMSNEFNIMYRSDSSARLLNNDLLKSWLYTKHGGE